MSPTKELVLASQSMLRGVWFHHLCLQAMWPSLLIRGLPIKFGPDAGWCVLFGAVYSTYTAGRKRKNSHWDNYLCFSLQKPGWYDISLYMIVLLVLSLSPLTTILRQFLLQDIPTLHLLLTWLTWSCYQATTLMQASFHISKLPSLTSPVFPLEDCPAALWRCRGDSSALSEQS